MDVCVHMHVCLCDDSDEGEVASHPGLPKILFSSHNHEKSEAWERGKEGGGGGGGGGEESIITYHTMNLASHITSSPPPPPPPSTHTHIH